MEDVSCFANFKRVFVYSGSVVEYNMMPVSIIILGRVRTSNHDNMVFCNSA